MGGLGDDPYAVAELYDLEYAGHAEDVGWYVERARAARGPVLELGCGTGRLTLPIARVGIRVLGVDRASAMLAGLRTKLKSEPQDVQLRVQTLDADYQALDLDQRFSGVLWPFNALHHCEGPDHVVRVLDRVREWLVPGGQLSLDCYLPDMELYDRDPEGRYEHRTFDDPRTGAPLESWEQGWWDPQTRVHHVLYVYRHANGTEERTRLQLRMYELPELKQLLTGAGWTIRAEAQDFQGTAVGTEALKWVAVLDPPGR